MNGHHRDSGRNTGNWDLEPPARRRCSNHWTSKDDIVRLRVTKRGQQQPDHIATYRVFWEASERYPARVRLGCEQSTRHRSEPGPQEPARFPPETAGDADRFLRSQ